MKRLLIILVLLLAAPLALFPLSGIALRDIPTALTEGAGLGAKLACSGYYLSGFSDDQNRADIAAYSPLVGALSIEHVQGQRLRASMLGLSSASARYRPGLGCALEYPGETALNQLTTAAREAGREEWPLGELAPVPEPHLQALLQRQLQRDSVQGYDTRALLIVHKGRLAAESYADGISSDTPLLGWSMAKSVTAIILGRLEALGLVSPSEAGLFQEWAGDRRAGITLENLLQMSSGLLFNEYYMPGGDATRMLFASPSAATVALQSPLGDDPGRRFYYSSGTSNLLARLAHERLGGESQGFLQFFAEEFAAPLALANTTLELDASGVFVGSSFAYATARDWARLGQLMLAGGELNGRRLLTQDWVKRATAPNHSVNDPRYGYQFWLNDGGPELRWPSLPVDAYAMQGNRDQVVMVIPSSDTVIVRLGWSAGDYPVDQRFTEIVKTLEAQ